MFSSISISLSAASSALKVASILPLAVSFEASYDSSLSSLPYLVKCSTLNVQMNFSTSYDMCSPPASVIFFLRRDSF